MNGFKKNKNGTTKKRIKPDITAYQVGEEAAKEYKPESYQNTKSFTKKTV